MSRPKTVLVTGAAGYVATHCIVELIDKRFSIVAIDNFSNSMRGQSTLVAHNS